MPLYSDARSLQRICGQRLKGFEKQKKEAINERSEKKKMHAVKSMEKRFQREDENMTEMPETEDAIYFKLGDENSEIPAGKTVIEYFSSHSGGRENLHHWQQRKRKDNTVKENIRGVVTEKGYSCRIYAAKL